MNKKGLRDTFCRLTNINSKSLSNYYCDCFIEAMRLGIVEDGELLLPNMFRIVMKTVPAGTKPVFNPSSGKFNTRKEHKYLKISENGDKLLKSDFHIRYKVGDKDE